MSAQMRIIPPSEADAGFGLLKDIVALAKNPGAIEEAHEKLRNEAILTSEQQAKYREALDFINSYEGKKKEIEAAWDELKKAKADHEKAVNAYGESIAKDNERFNEWEKRLKEKEDAQKMIEEDHRKKKEAIEASKKEADDYRTAALNEAVIAKSEAIKLLEDTKLTHENAQNLKKHYEDKLSKLQALVSE